MRALLLACLLTAGSPASAAAAPIVTFADIIVRPGETAQEWLQVGVGEPITGARVAVHLDTRLAKDFVDVSVDSPDCTINDDGFVSCNRMMDLQAGLTKVALVKFAKRGKENRARDVYAAGSVNDEQAQLRRYVISSPPGGKLTPIGATVSAVGKQQLKIRVGVRNARPGQIVMPQPSPDTHPVVAYILVPGNTIASSASMSCAGWGPYPAGAGRIRVESRTNSLHIVICRRYHRLFRAGA